MDPLLGLVQKVDPLAWSGGKSTLRFCSKSGSTFLGLVEKVDPLIGFL